MKKVTIEMVDGGVMTGELYEDIAPKTVENIEKICSEIQKNRPNAKIYVESVYPVNREMKNNMAGDRTNEVIKKINNNIKNFCKKSDITYINMYDSLEIFSDTLFKYYSTDGLHINKIGYKLITIKLLKYINE